MQKLCRFINFLRFSPLSNFRLIFANAFFLYFFLTFYEKMLQMFMNYCRSVPKLILQMFMLILFVPHTLKILFTTYWGNSCIFTTAVKSFVAEIHTKNSKFPFSPVFIAKNQPKFEKLIKLIWMLISLKFLYKYYVCWTVIWKYLTLDKNIKVFMVKFSICRSSFFFGPPFIWINDVVYFFLSHSMHTRA